jgi:hypothetical protein
VVSKTLRRIRFLSAIGHFDSLAIFFFLDAGNAWRQEEPFH